MARVRSKYRAKPCVIDGIRFDSLIEGERYGYLKLFERAGEICDLEIKPKFSLVCPPDDQPVGSYIADFGYRRVPEPGVKGMRVVEDVKGVITPLARWKLRHFKLQYGHEVKIVRKKDVKRL